MEEIMLKMYLKFQKDNNKPQWKNLLKVPVAIWLMLALAVLCLAVSAGLFFSNEMWISFCLMFVATILSIALNIWIDRYSIDHSQKELDNYRTYLEKLSSWLVQNEFSSMQSVKLLFERVKNKLHELQIEQKERNSRADRWIQLLVIPVVLAIITASIKSETDIVNMFAYSIAVIVLFMALYCIFNLFRGLIWFPKKRIIEQLGCFSNDLQSILDWEPEVFE